MRWSTTLVVLLLGWVGRGHASEEVVVTARGLVTGHLQEAGSTDVLHYWGLPGERLRLRIRRLPNPDLADDLLVSEAILKPQVEVLFAGGDSPLATSVSKGKRAALDVELPSAGPYEIRVTGLLNSYGVYRLKCSAKWPRAARASAFAPTTEPGHVLFFGRPGLRFSAVLRPAPGDSGPVPVPTLLGPTGPIDLAPYAKVGANRVRLRNVPLAISGAYALVHDAGLEVTTRLRPRRSPKNVLHRLEDPWVGTWLREGTVLGVAGQLLTLHADRGGPENVWIQETEEFVRTWPIESWRTDPVGLSDAPLAVTLKLDLGEFLYEPKVPEVPLEPGASSGGWWSVVLDPEDPEAFFFTSSEIRWRRSYEGAPAPPDVTAVVTTNPGHPDAADAQVALIIERVPGIRRFEIHRAEPGATDLPGQAHRVVFPATKKADTVTWIDTGAAPGDGSTYWVRAWSDVGPSPFSEPVNAPDS